MHETWYSGDLGWEASTYHIVCPFDQVVMQQNKIVLYQVPYEIQTPNLAQ